MYKKGKVGDCVRINQGGDYNRIGTITSTYSEFNHWIYHIKLDNQEFTFYDDEIDGLYEPNELFKQLI